MKEDPINLL